ncbi:hypothetical protein BJF78_27835 [Pseudonocardia sp. CNS-139]|nr:hypothetical protein BJF78_27835 [Pseudonocardia sp. CNS-139]
MTRKCPVGQHVAALERALHGPGRVRRSMVREVRDGLDDAVDAYCRGGLDPDAAAAQAVRDFGPVHEIAPQMQEELAARQGRRTAALVMVAFPGLVIAWDVVWRSGTAWHPGEIAPVSLVMARLEDVTAIVGGLAGLVLVVAGFLRLVPQRLVTALAGLLAGVGGLVCAGAAVLMNVASPTSSASLVATNPLVLPAFVVSGVMFLAIMRAGFRALRAARRRVPSDE